MLVVHGTRAFRDRISGPLAADGDASTTLLGSWYATVLRWRRPVALFVNEATLLPVLVPLAPARTVLARFPAALADVLNALGVPASVIDDECDQMAPARVAPTDNRSVLGVMNEFAYLADAQRDEATELRMLSLRLAATPCGPLYKCHISPDREVVALIADHPPNGATDPRPNHRVT